MIRLLALTLLILTYIAANAQLYVTFTPDKNAFPLSTNTQGTATICVSPKDAVVVNQAAQMLADDIGNVTESVAPKVMCSVNLPKDPYIILAGTIGQNVAIDQLIAKDIIDVSKIKNGCEQYIITTIEKPSKGVKKALVIVGSDRRGTAYGILELSKKMGVSPWNWWADVTPVIHDEIYVSGNETSKRPTVKYRGIFINDEDWGLKPWSSLNYEKELGDIGPKTYRRVCELLLRLKANMLAPAMHSCTGAFYTHPESKLVADSLAIIITTSHCEPLLLNNADRSEWDSKRDGEWNYATNKHTIHRKWEKRLSEAAQFENIYTTAMRGVHDEGLRGNLPMNERIPLIKRVIEDQRTLLQRYVKKDAEDIPQIFVPYKETMDIYENGLDVPDDITLVWVDDNYGYMKRVSDEQEQRRSGHAGVYYHLSYLGAPHDYLWLNTTAPVLMYEELMKAYNTGADRYWLLNVGDIKPAELGIQTFMDLAWNVNEFNVETINQHQANFLANIFGKQYETHFQYILDTFYRLAWSRKPEFMGWEREWDSPQYTGMRDTEFSFKNYNDAQLRLAEYQQIVDSVDSIQKLIPQKLADAYYQLLQFPIHGAKEMNRKFLMAQLNHELAEQGDMEGANWAATQATQAFDAIEQLHRHYDAIKDGKWNHFMALSPAICSLSHKMPNITRFEDAGEKIVDINPSSKEFLLDRCTVIDITKPHAIHNDGGNHTIRNIEGIGYDWKAIQLGLFTEPVCDPSSNMSPYIDYSFNIDSDVNDSICIYVYTVPFFPLHKERELRFGVSIDGSTTIVCNNKFKEWAVSWKDQVLQNGHLDSLKFKASQGEHTLTFHIGDPGIIIQRIIIDWGGLKHSYVGPSMYYMSK